MVTFEFMKRPVPDLYTRWKQKSTLLYRRWPWHLFFWVGYVLFRFWPYYITVQYFSRTYLEFMLLSEILFVAVMYITIWLYKRFFENKKYGIYFAVGTGMWLLYLYTRTMFQFYYLKNEPGFANNAFSNTFLSHITSVIIGFLFITACKYFKEGYIRQQLDEEKKQQQLLAEVNNLKSQIAPHFLFNTLNNLYGLAVDKSDKLPDLMLRLSDLLRHSLYETQKPLVCINDELNVLKSYIQLESVRLEEDLKLQFDNTVPEESKQQIAPLLLIVFVENAFKHAKLVQTEAVNIYIKTTLENNWFSLMVKNNYHRDNKSSNNGIGLMNVKRRLEVLYPNWQHQLVISKDEEFYTTVLELQLVNSENVLQQ